jgi:uncharacterized protein (TIGR00730 family)
MSDKVEQNLNNIMRSSTYRLAIEDPFFLKSPELRSVRVQLELLKPELAFSKLGIQSTIVAFGGTQIVEEAEATRKLTAAKSALKRSPENTGLKRAVERGERVLAKSVYYEAARQFARIVSTACQAGEHDYVISTGGGPGIMEASNRGAFEAGGKSIGLNISLPAEQRPNPYITPELCFQFQYFAMRKLHFLMRAKALVVFPGGFGTLDELFDALTLRQTHRMQAIPIILFGRDYWSTVINFEFMADEGVIADEHLELVQFAETPEEAWEIICDFHGES